MGSSRNTAEGEPVTPPAGPNDVTWDHVSLAGAPALATVAPGAPLAFEEGALVWGENSAHVADVALQRPVRILIHARLLLSPPASPGSDGSV